MKTKGVNTMNITDVRVRKVAKEGKMKAVVSITIDEEFVVHDIKVIEGEKGLFIAMPSRKAKCSMPLKMQKEVKSTSPGTQQACSPAIPTARAAPPATAMTAGASC